MYSADAVDSARTFFSLIKNNEGFFKSTKQATFLLKRLRGMGLTQTYMSELKKHFKFDPQTQMPFLYMWNLGFGRSDVSKIRYACTFFLLDSQGVVARYKVGVNHKPTEDDTFQPNFKKIEKVWVRTEEKLPFPDFSFFDKEKKEIAIREALYNKKLKPLVEKIRATIPEEKINHSDFLHSILYQLEKEKRVLSEPQIVALNRIFERYDVSAEKSEGYLSEGPVRWASDYKTLAKFLYQNFQVYLQKVEELDREHELSESGSLENFEPQGLWATETELREFLQGYNNTFASVYGHIFGHEASSFVRKISKARMLSLYEFTGEITSAIKKKGKRLSKKQQKAIMLLPEFIKTCEKVLGSDNLISNWDDYYIG